MDDQAQRLGVVLQDRPGGGARVLAAAAYLEGQTGRVSGTGQRVLTVVTGGRVGQARADVAHGAHAQGCQMVDDEARGGLLINPHGVDPPAGTASPDDAYGHFLADGHQVLAGQPG